MHLHGLIAELNAARTSLRAEQSRVDAMTFQLEEAVRQDLEVAGVSAGLLSRLQLDDLLDLHNAFLGKRWELSEGEMQLLERAVVISPVMNDNFREHLIGILTLVRARAGLEATVTQETVVLPPVPAHRQETLRVD